MPPLPYNIQEVFMVPSNTVDVIKHLNTILDIEQDFSGLKYLKQLVQNIAHIFDIRYVLIGHAVAPENNRVQTDIVWAGNGYAPNFIYDLKDTPCENVLSGNRVCIYPDGVADRFPEDKLLVEMGVQSYIGAPMFIRQKQLFGILVLLDDKLLTDMDSFSGAIEFLAMRMAVELEKYYIEEELKRQVNEKTFKLEKINRELKSALDEITTLRGIIPICANCKKIRDDKGCWNQLEVYIEQHSEAHFSHGICQECARKLYGDMANT